MRVISGKARGTKLNSIESLSTRPTLDRVKESLFNIIQNDIKDANVLDLFAGSGALGIECLSRGARFSVFCDNNAESIKMIKQNLDKTHLTENAKVINKSYESCLNTLNDKFDLIFLDPPYKLDIAVKALKIILDKNILNNNGLVIIETDEIERDKQEIELLKNVRIIDERKYGRANLIFIKEEN